MKHGLIQASDWNEYQELRLEQMEQRVRNGELAEMVAPDYARSQTELENLMMWLEPIEAEAEREREEEEENVDNG